MFRVAIIGGETATEFNIFKQKCIFYLKNKAKEGGGITILTTGDEYVDKFAKQFNIDTQFFISNWKLYGKNALKKRNEELLEKCDALIYFNDGIKDNKMIYDLAQKFGLSTRIVNL